MTCNRAVVAWSGLPNDDGAILHMSGESILGLFGPGGTYSAEDSVGCTAAPLHSCPGMPRGISVWEGEINDEGGTESETGFAATGSYRRPTQAELVLIVEGISPWSEQMKSDEPVRLVARMEHLATLSRKAQEIVRRHPDCIYQDDDSVVMRDTPGSQTALLEMRSELDRLYDSYHAYPVDTPK